MSIELPDSVREQRKGDMGQHAIDHYVARLQPANDPFQRFQAAKALGLLGDGRAVVSLSSRLQDPEWQVRWGAMQARGQLGDARAVEPLLARRHDSWGLISSDADTALRQLGSALGSAAFVTALRPALQHPGPHIRVAVARYLGTQGDASAVEPLIAVLGDRDVSVRFEVIHDLIWL